MNNNLILCDLEEVIFNISPKIVYLLYKENLIDKYYEEQDIYNREHYSLLDWLHIDNDKINFIYKKYKAEFYDNINVNTYANGLQIGLRLNNFSLMCFSEKNEYLDSGKISFFNYIFNKQAKLILLDNEKLSDYIKDNSLLTFNIYLANRNSNIIELFQNLDIKNKEFRIPSFKYNDNYIEKLLLEDYMLKSDSNFKYNNPVN